jgi:hypothetical protein
MRISTKYYESDQIKENVVGGAVTDVGERRNA